MRAGLLRDVISIRYPVTTARSTDGAPIETESTLLKNVWARVDHKTGSETYRNRNRWEINETDFFIRYTTAAITKSMHVNYNGNDYDIKAIINVDERDREIQLITKKYS
jgi:SPP1 family predicted phage head-tail adaptor